MKKCEKALIVVAVVMIAGLSVLAFEFGDLLIISKTKTSFLLDEKVGQEAHEYNDTMLDFEAPTPRPPHDLLAEIPEPPPGYKLVRRVPAYMKKYGLNFDDYKDDGPYSNFLPKGSDWKKWGTDGRTVAVLNWVSHELSVYQIHATIHCVNKYLGNYDVERSIIPVIRACSDVPDWARQQAKSPTTP